MADADLARRIRDGSEEAFAEFYGRFKGPVFRFAFQMTGSFSAAEEITQEAFAAFVAEAGGYDERRGGLAAYLFGIARNRIRGHLRSRARRGRSEAEALMERYRPAVQCPQERNLLRSEKLRLVRRAVLALPERYREVVVLCDLQEFSYDRAANVLGCRIGTVRSRLHRARKLLARKLAENRLSVLRLESLGETP
jgi:RNA polymerase sigma-70 factor, ECF subfamily